MAKTPPIQDIQSGFSSTITLNSNFTALRDAFDNTLSLDGSTPNAMQAELDLANNNIINVSTLEADALLLNGVPITPSNAAGAAFQNITVFGSNLIDDQNASEARTTLGLATVAATGSYTDLINTPTLGTAAATNSTAYATAAQGSLADTSVQVTDTLLTSDWQAGTSTSEAIVSPAKVKAAIDELVPLQTTTGSAPYFGARAWVSFNGYNGSINASGNVTSVTRNGIGDYTITFTTAMPDANYTVHAMPTRNRTDRPYWVYHLQPNSTGDITTSSVRLRGGYVSGTNDGSYNQPSDFPQVSVVIFR